MKLRINNGTGDFDVSAATLGNLSLPAGATLTIGATGDTPWLENLWNMEFYPTQYRLLESRGLAERVVEHAPAKINVTASNDPRSYLVNSDRLLAAGFRPKKTIDDAIKELVHKFRSGELKDEERFHNLKWMQREVVR